MIGRYPIKLQFATVKIKFFYDQSMERSAYSFEGEKGKDGRMDGEPDT